MAKRFQVDAGSTLTTSLVSYWKLDGNSNDFNASNNGTDTVITYQSSPAIKTQSANFASASSSKIVLTQPSFGSADRSVSFWINTGTNTANQNFIGNRNDSVAWWRVLTKDSTHFYYETQSNLVTSNAITFANSAWHHVIITMSGTTMAFYFDGSAAGGATVTASNTNSSSNEMQFGASHHSGYTDFYNGNLDEIGVWTKTLSAQEISDLYNGGAGNTMLSFSPATGMLSVF